MRKLRLFMIAPLIVATIGASVGFTYSGKTEDLVLNDEVTSVLTDNFASTFKIDTQVTFGYENFVPSLELIDEIGEEKRSNVIMARGRVLSDVHMLMSPTGGTIQEFLNLNNKIVTRPVTNQEGEEISYDGNFGNPFKNFSSLNNKQINDYFNISKVDTTYVLSANELGYGVLTSPFSSFVSDFDNFTWDYQSLTYLIDDFNLVINEDGTPISFSYNKIKKDRYGAIKDQVSSKYEKISEVRSITPVKSNLTEEQRNTFVNNMNAFQEKIKDGNFTETITATGVGTYNNYYDYSAKSDRLPAMMLSSQYLYDAHYGRTFVGCVKTHEGYQPYGISPEAGVNDVISQETYDTLDKVLPDFSFISPDFFQYVDGEYIFPIGQLIYADTLFNLDVLRTTVGLCDPLVSFVGSYLNYGAYNFAALSFTFDENNYPVGKLMYLRDNDLQSSTFTFSNIGTTNLENEESIRDAINSLLQE